MSAASLSTIPTEPERAILTDLQVMTYREVAAKHDCSHGRIWRIAARHGARKHEERIARRRTQMRQDQLAVLQEILDTTATADVLDYLGSLPDACASLVLTSVPYNVGRPYGQSRSADRMRHVYYHGWLMQIVSEASRILRDGGILFLQVGSTRDENESLVPIDVLLFDSIRRTGLEFQSRIAWVVGHGLTPRRRLSERYETALVFSKGPPATFNPTPARTPQKNPSKRAFKGPSAGRLSGHPLGAWPSNVWTIPNVGHNHPERTGHPAQFPLELARRAVQIYTNPGDVVVDPFSGSGTTHVACRETGRSFTGCDLFYEDVRARRLAAATPDTVCLLPGVTDHSLAVWQAEARRVDLPANAPQPTSV